MKPLRKTTHARNPLSSTMLASTSEDLDLPLDDVVVVFACSENFVPYLSVAVQSIIENASLTRRYDIVVLTRDISPASMITLTRQAKSDNVGIGFLDVDAALGDIKLPHHGHFRPETYYRLLSPQLLPNVDKAIYLDSDLIVCDDVAKLYDVDVKGYKLAATRDADTIGQIDGYDATVGPYLKNELGMSDPHDYFQAGVLLMNLAELRRTITPEEFLDLSTQRMWRWLDQDILNKVVNGDYVRVHMRWNYLMDWQHLRRTHIIANAPADVREEYEQAAADPAIIHFAGPDNRPGSTPTRTARMTSGATRCAHPTWTRFAASSRSRAPRQRGLPSACRSSRSTRASCLPSTPSAPPGPCDARPSSAPIWASAAPTCKLGTVPNLHKRFL